MRKFYFLFLMLACANAASAQVPNAGMESWRSSSSVGTFGIPPHTPVPIEVPTQWYGSDSIIISLGQTLNPLIGAHDSDWRRQIFKEISIVHGGSSSAKIMTVLEDTFLIPGVISNAVPSVSLNLTSSPPTISSVKLNGGSPITSKPTSVSAWVQYAAGTGGSGIDSGSLSVQALGHLGGKDSVIGNGFVSIAPTGGSWVQVTANLIYTDTTVAVDTFRIALSSSNRPFGLKGSTLYADDITMTTVPNPDHTGIKNITGTDPVKIYPNPSGGIIYVETAQHDLNCDLYNMSGRLEMTQPIGGNGRLDASSLADGLYFYVIHNGNGEAVQRGKITLIK